MKNTDYNPQIGISKKDARKLFVEMVENTKEYLTMYDLSSLSK